MLELQMKFLEQKPRKACSYHNREAQLMCFKLSCGKFPYLCLACAQENVHGHQDGIANYFDAVKELCTDINQKCLNTEANSSKMVRNNGLQGSE